MFLLPSILRIGILLLRLFTVSDAVEPERISTVRSYKLEFFEGGKSWELSQKSCEERDSWLVEIEDEEIFNAVMKLKLHHKVWISAYYHEGWTWNGRNPIHYENWRSGYPFGVTAGFNNGCGRMQEDGSWINIDCTRGYRYICQSDMNYPGSFNVTFVGNDLKSFDKAKQACKSMDNSTLVKIKTSALNSLIGRRISGEQNEYWTSGNDVGEEGKWKWGDGNPINISSTNWMTLSGGTKEPNGGTAENCLATSYSGWLDEACGKSKGYICQKNLTTGNCESNVCTNRGTCVITGRRFLCSCDAGYFGTKCEYGQCSLSPCTNGGTCRDATTTPFYQCTCTPAYTGPQCEDRQCSLSPCKNRGTCRDTTTTPYYQCSCKTAYVGPRCEDRQCSLSSCKNGGTCRDTTTTPYYQCFCTPAYIGPRCEDRHCSLSPCKSGGTCRDTSTTPYYQCDCTSANIGPRCEDRQCSLSPCKNGGTCRDTTTTPYYQCFCTPAYIGPRCEDPKFITAEKCKYHINKDYPMTFIKANSTCLKLGGSLTMLKTLEVQNLVEQQVIAQYGASGNMELWVGGYKNKNQWFWMDGRKIPLSGENQKWKDNSNSKDYMLISAWGSTRDNMHWYSKRNEINRGYVCEVAVANPCGSVNCQNGVKCIRTGCQGNCFCAPGFHGYLCQKDRIILTPNNIEYIVVQGESTVVNLNITSNHGPIEIAVLRGDTSIEVFRNIASSINITIGPFQHQTSGDKYIFRATPESARGSYFKYAYVTIRVEGSPTVKISPYILALPTGKRISHIRCEATGVTKPSISWKQDGVDVTTSRTAAVSQFTHNGYRWLAFLSKARTEVGYYTCYAENKVALRKRLGNATLFVRGTLKLVNKTETQSESSFESSTLSCTYEGYPAPRVHWGLGTSGNSQLNEMWSLFEIQNVVEKGTSLNRSTSTLTIRLPEHLGAMNLFCQASNNYENTTASSFMLNKYSVLWKHDSYRIYTEKNEQRNFTDARAFCQSRNRTLIVITDRETQEMISKELTNCNETQNGISSVFIGVQKISRKNITMWQWINNNVSIDSDTKNRRNVINGQAMNGSYAAWTDGEPNEPANKCAVLDGSKEWLWSDTNCNNEIGFICRSHVPGMPQIMCIIVVVENSTANISVEWKPAEKAIGVRHRTKILLISPVTDNMIWRRDIIPIERSSTIQKIFHLSLGTAYNLSITVCPECPLHGTSRTIVETFHIPSEAYQGIGQSKFTIGEACEISTGSNITTTDATVNEDESETDGSKLATTYVTSGISQTNFSNMLTATIVISALLFISIIFNAIFIVKFRKYLLKSTDHAEDHDPSLRPYETTYLGESPYHYDNDSNVVEEPKTPQNNSKRSAPVDSTNSAYEVPRPLNDETNPYEEVKITK